jgi:hypothetical protein
MAATINKSNMSGIHDLTIFMTNIYNFYVHAKEHLSARSTKQYLTCMVYMMQSTNYFSSI